MKNTHICECGKRMSTFDTRLHEISGVAYTRRRKGCTDCRTSFYTGEIPEEIVREILSDD